MSIDSIAEEFELPRDEVQAYYIPKYKKYKQLGYSGKIARLTAEISTHKHYDRMARHNWYNYLTNRTRGKKE
jgi:hypothetical protein